MEYQTAIAALLTGIGTLIGSLLTLWWTKGVDAAIRLKKADGEEARALLIAKKESNMLALESALSEMEHLKTRIASVEKCADEIRHHYGECMEKHQECEIRCARMEGRLDRIEREGGLPPKTP